MNISILYFIYKLGQIAVGQIFPSSPLQKNIWCSWIKLVKYQMSISNLTRKHGNPEIRWCMVSLLLYDWYLTRILNRWFPSTALYFSLSLLCISLFHWTVFISFSTLYFSLSLLCISLFLYISMTNISSIVINKFSISTFRWQILV